MMFEDGEGNFVRGAVSVGIEPQDYGWYFWRISFTRPGSVQVETQNAPTYARGDTLFWVRLEGAIDTHKFLGHHGSWTAWQWSQPTGKWSVATGGVFLPGGSAVRESEDDGCFEVSGPIGNVSYYVWDLNYQGIDYGMTWYESESAVRVSAWGGAYVARYTYP